MFFWIVAKLANQMENVLGEMVEFAAKPRQRDTALRIQMDFPNAYRCQVVYWEVGVNQPFIVWQIQLYDPIVLLSASTCDFELIAETGVDCLDPE